MSKRIVRPLGAPRSFFYTPKPEADHVTLQNYQAGTLAVLAIDNCVFPFQIRRTSDEAPVHELAEPATLMAFKTGDGHDSWTIFAQLPPFVPSE